MFWASDVYSVQDQRSIIQDHYFGINDPIQNHYIYHPHTQALTNNKSNNKFHHSNFVWRIFIVLSSIRPPAQCSGKILQKQQKLNFVKLVFNILLNYLIYFRQFLQLGVIMSDGHVNYSNQYATDKCLKSPHFDNNYVKRNICWWYFSPVILE